MDDEPDPPVVVENRVRFAETDLQGVVFYGTFFTYQDEAFNAYFRRIGHPYQTLLERGWTTHTVHADLDYYAPARFGEVVRNGLRFRAIGDSSLTAAYAAWRKDSGERLAAGTVVHVAVDPETDESVRVPEYFREAVVGFQDHPPDPV